MRDIQLDQNCQIASMSHDYEMDGRIQGEIEYLFWISVWLLVSSGRSASPDSCSIQDNTSVIIVLCYTNWEDSAEGFNVRFSNGSSYCTAVVEVTRKLSPIALGDNNLTSMSMLQLELNSNWMTVCLFLKTQKLIAKLSILEE